MSKPIFSDKNFREGGRGADTLPPPLEWHPPVDDGPATPWSTAHDSVLVQAAGATVAVFAVMLDFDFIERGSKDGRPKNMEWMAG